jgi:hypothetical protein
MSPNLSPLSGHSWLCGHDATIVGHPCSKIGFRKLMMMVVTNSMAKSAGGFQQLGAIPFIQARLDEFVLDCNCCCNK